MANDVQVSQEVPKITETQPVLHEGSVLSDAGKSAMQGPLDAPSPPLPPTETTVDPLAPPDGHIPKIAIGERGDADRAETGAEKPEVKIHHGLSQEGGKPVPPAGWKPGGIEGGA